MADAAVASARQIRTATLADAQDIAKNNIIMAQVRHSMILRKRRCVHLYGLRVAGRRPEAMAGGDAEQASIAWPVPQSAALCTL